MFTDVTTPGAVGTCTFKVAQWRGSSLMKGSGMDQESHWEIGDVVPVAELRAEAVAAVVRARTGRCTFHDHSEVNVDFSVTDVGTDVHIRGLGESGKAEVRVVGDFRYYLTDAPERPWKWDDLTSTDPLDRFIVEMGRDTTAIGTPLGLLAGMHGEEATVMKRSGSVTTIQVPVRLNALMCARGDLSRGADDETTIGTLWDVDSDRLLRRVVSRDLDVSFEFSDWGCVPRVAAPPADQAESNKEWLINGGLS